MTVMLTMALDLSSITIVSAPVHGSIDSINANGSVTYHHDGSETTSDSFSYTIRDISGAVSSAVTVSLTITANNDTPVALADSFSVNEGATATLNLALNDSDADDGLDLSSITIVSAPVHGSIDSINADGSVTYRHDGSETATDTFSYSIKDISGAISNVVTVNLVITADNDTPVALADSFSVNEGATATLNLALNDSDADDGLDLSSITIVSAPVHGSIDSINANGSVTYHHDGSETTSDSFSYTIRDISGAVSSAGHGQFNHYR